MRLNKYIQYSILLVLYLTRSGRSNLETISKNLELSLPFLEQIARKLRMFKIIKSIRGPGGGYEIIGEPTLSNIFNAIDPIELIKIEEQTAYMKKEVEHRALLNISSSLSASMRIILKRKIKDICNETQVNEAALFKTLDLSKAGH